MMKAVFKKGRPTYQKGARGVKEATIPKNRDDGGCEQTYEKKGLKQRLPVLFNIAA